MSQVSSINTEHRARQADTIADAIVATLPVGYDSRTILSEYPAGWDKLLAALDTDDDEQRYDLFLSAMQTATRTEVKKLALKLDECVGARMALWAEVHDCFYRALARRQRQCVDF